MSHHRSFVGRLIPDPGGDWVRAHRAERQAIESQRELIRWRLGLVRVTVAALVFQIAKHPRTFIGSVLSRTLVALVAGIELAMASLLVSLVIRTPQPTLVFGLVGVLTLQGTTTILVLRMTGAGRGDRVRQALLVLGVASVVVGSLAAGFGALRNLGPDVVDPEFGPTVVATLIACHGVATLIAFGRSSAT